MNDLDTFRRRPRPAPQRANGRELTSVSQVRRVLRFLRSGDHLWWLLEQQARVVHEGAVALTTSAEHGRDAVDRSEVEGERISLEIETELRRSFLVPIDREDLHELSSGLDCVLALTTYSRRAFVMLDIAPSAAPMNRLEELLVSCTFEIEEAIRHLRRREYDLVVDVSRELRRLQRVAGIVHDEALSTLLREDDSRAGRTLIRKKTTLDNLAETIRRCGALGKYLAYLAAKNA